MNYEIGSTVTEGNATFIVTEHKHWTHGGGEEMVTIMGRRFIKSRNEFAKNAGDIAYMGKEYYDANYRG